MTVRVKSGNSENRYPFFQEVFVGNGVSVQLVWLTPEFGQAILDRNGRTQRNPKKEHLVEMIDDIKNDRFMFTGQTIIQDSNGDLIDGQHRIKAVIEAGKPILVLLVRNVDPDAYYAIDNTARRQISDVMRSDGYDNVAALGCALRHLDRYHNGKLMGMGSYTQSRLSTPAARELLQEHPDLSTSIHVTTKIGRICRSWGAMGFCHYIFSQKDPKAAEQFFHFLTTGEGLFEGDPILALRKRFLEAKHHISNFGDEVIFLTFKAWDMWRTGRKIKIMKKRDGENLRIPV